jgi:hypothetical protein
MMRLQQRMYKKNRVRGVGGDVAWGDKYETYIVKENSISGYSSSKNVSINSSSIRFESR